MITKKLKWEQEENHIFSAQTPIAKFFISGHVNEWAYWNSHNKTVNKCESLEAAYNLSQLVYNNMAIMLLRDLFIVTDCELKMIKKSSDISQEINEV